MNSPAHIERMRARRERQLARQPEFTPVANRRVGAAIAAGVGALVEAGVDQLAAFHIVVRQIAQALPPAAMIRRAPRPSKSDDAAYRKLNPARAMLQASLACPALA